MSNFSTSTASAYRQLKKPSTLLQYHRVEETLNSEFGFCGVISIPSEITKQAQQGKSLFKNNCAQCHNKNMRDYLTG